MSSKESFKNKITRNLLLSLGFTVVAVVVVALIVHIMTFYRTVEDYNNTSSDIIANFLNEQINETVTDLTFLSELIISKNSNHDTYLMNFISQYSHYSSIWITDSAGIIMNIYPGEKFLAGTDRSGSEAYNDIITKKKKSSLSSVFLSPETNLPSFDVAIPFNNGVLATTITSTVFTNHIMSLEEGTQKFLALTDAQASWLSHADIKKIVQREADEDFKKYSYLSGKNSTNIISKEKGKYYMRYIRPIDGSGWFLSIYNPLNEILFPLITLFLIIIIVSIPIVIFSFGISFRVIKKMFTPMENFVNAAEMIGEGDYHYSIPSTGYVEFDRVKTGLTKMVQNIDQREKEQKELWMQLLQSQKMEAIGSLASGVAHDFNNLLTAIGGYSDIISINFEEDSKEQIYINEVNKAVERATALTRQLLAFSRKDMFKTESVDLNNLIEGIIKMLNRIAGEDIDIVMNLSSDIDKIQADPHQFEQILLNLAVNARDALLEANVKDPVITIQTEHCDSTSGTQQEFVKIIISDNGPGIPEGIRGHIFESFFTTKAKGKGTGLGLSTVKGIVDQNRAQIEVGRGELGGAEFKILWPVSSEGYNVDESSGAKQHQGFEKKRILYVDDEKLLCEITSEMLKKLNHHAEVAFNGEEALKLIEDAEGNFDLVITDMIMPKMGGEELSSIVQKKWPKIKFIYVTGYVGERIEKSGIDLESDSFLRKPFNMADLTLTLSKIFT